MRLKKLFKELIQRDIDPIEREKSNNIKKNNILKILENINAIFTGTYLQQGKLPKETEFERSIADRVKLRQQKLDIINKNELFKEYFNYSNADTMIKRFKNINDKINKNMVGSINKNLNKMKKIIKNVPENKTFKIEENQKVIDIVERILELNSEKQLVLGLKILTPPPC